jgi:hypothetical protein
MASIRNWDFKGRYKMNLKLIYCKKERYRIVIRNGRWIAIKVKEVQE